jgi:hypothetical protein
MVTGNSGVTVVNNPDPDEEDCEKPDPKPEPEKECCSKTYNITLHFH